MSQKYKCASCEHIGAKAAFPDAADLPFRLEPGDEYTDKECPECGALAFPVADVG